MRKKYFTEEERKAAKNISAKKYYATEKGKFNKVDYDRNYRKSNKEKLNSYRQSRRKTKEGYIDRFLERAKIYTPDTDLDREYLSCIFTDRCAITNKSFEYEKTYEAYHNALAPSIDRIDSKIGYYKGNIQIILSCMNRMKGDMPNEDFLKLWKALEEN